MTETVPVSPAPSKPETPSRWTFTRIVMLGAFVLVAIVVIIFLVAAVAAFLNAQGAASFFRYIRDVALVVVFLEIILIIAGVAIMLVQIGRFINLLRSEVKPITEDAKETLKSVRTTTEFVGKSSIEPIVAIKSFFSGFGTFIVAFSNVNALLRLFRKPTPHDPTK